MTSTRYSIGTKIFGAFVAMGAIIAVLGAVSYAVLASAGDMAVTTFDGPLMAINYARAAQTDFTQLQMDELRFENAAAAEKKGIAADIADTVSTFNDDLAVAEQRSFAADEQSADPPNPGASGAMARSPHPRRHENAGTAGRPDRRQVRSSDRTQHGSLFRQPPSNRHQHNQLPLRHHWRHDFGARACGRHYPVPAPAHHPAARRRSRRRRPNRQRRTSDRYSTWRLGRDRRPAKIHDGDAGQHTRDDVA